MLPPPRLAEMIEAIYDSAVDPSAWPTFFELLRTTEEFHSGALMIVEPERRTTRFSSHWGVSFDLLRSIEARHSNDPTMVFLHKFGDPARDPNEPIVYRQVFDDDFLAKSPLYQEINHQVPMADSIAILALAKGDRLGFLTALRHHPGERYGEREVGLMRRLAPHLRRAVTISDILEMRTFEGLALAATLDALALGVLIVDADARVLHANSAAKTLLDTGEALHLNLSRLTAAGNRETAQLRAAISSAAVPLGALIGSEDHSSSPPASQGVRLTTSDAPPTIAHVLPLANSGLRFASSAIAAVFIKSADTDPSSSSSGVWKFFGLTAAEQRLASRLASGVTLAAAAQALGISENTAKTHLGRIYSKVGVSRQSELVALAARLAPPLRGQT